MNTDHQKLFSAQLDEIKSTDDFCKEWTSKWRGLAVAAQSLLSVFLPAGAKVLGLLITLADGVCPAKSGS